VKLKLPSDLSTEEARNLLVLLHERVHTKPRIVWQCKLDLLQWGLGITWFRGCRSVGGSVLEAEVVVQLGPYAIVVRKQHVSWNVACETVINELLKEQT
jgi:hypothetical protein